MKISLYCPTEDERTDHTYIAGRLCVCSQCGREVTLARIPREPKPPRIPGKRGRKPAFTPEQLAPLIERRRAGESLASIAASCDKCAATIFRYLKDVVPVKPELPALPMPPAEPKKPPQGKTVYFPPKAASPRKELRLQRLLNIVRIMLGAPVHVPDLAKQNGVSMRSVERDIHVLAAAGFAIIPAGKGTYKLDRAAAIAQALTDNETLKETP